MLPLGFVLTTAVQPATPQTRASATTKIVSTAFASGLDFVQRTRTSCATKLTRLSPDHQTTEPNVVLLPVVVSNQRLV